MFKYSLDQKVFYLMDNKVHSASVLSRKYVDNHKESWHGDPWKRFGDFCNLYSTIHGQFSQHQIFASLQDLKDSL